MGTCASLPAGERPGQGSGTSTVCHRERGPAHAHTWPVTARPPPPPPRCPRPHRPPQRDSRFCTAGTVEFVFWPVTRWRSSTTCTASGSLAAEDPEEAASGKAAGGHQPQTPARPVGAVSSLRPCGRSACQGFGAAGPRGLRTLGSRREARPARPLPAPPTPTRSPLKLAPASFTKSSTTRGRRAKPGALTSSYTEGCREGRAPVRRAQPGRGRGGGSAYTPGFWGDKPGGGERGACEETRMSRAPRRVEGLGRDRASWHSGCGSWPQGL